MEPDEKVVLRRKRPLICQLIPFSIPMQKKLKQYGLLTDDMFQDILPEQAESSQMMKFLDQVMKKQNLQEPFDKIRFLLRDEGHGWVSDEMVMDLLAEKGELTIEEYINREAHMIVHRLFGQSKRISEKDKLDIAYLVAVRYQAAKEALHSQLDRASTERDEALAFKWAENAKLKALCEKINCFLQIQRLRLNEHVNISSAHEGTRDDPDPENKNLNYLNTLEETVDGALEVLARVLLERETLGDERKKCLRVLGIPTANVGLELAIERALRNAADDIRKSKREAEMTDQFAQDLDSRLRSTQLGADNEILAKDRQIQYLESQLKISKDNWRDLEKELMEARRKLTEYEKQTVKAKKRSEALEKTRRLGYYDPGWAEKAYEEHGIDPNDVVRLDNDQALVPVNISEDIKILAKPSHPNPKPTKKDPKKDFKKSTKSAANNDRTKNANTAANSPVLNRSGGSQSLKNGRVSSVKRK